MKHSYSVQKAFNFLFHSVLLLALSSSLPLTGITQGFSAPSSATFPAPTFNARTVEADFDSDGDVDILYQTGGNGTAFQYARSNGNGTFTIVTQSASPFANVSLPDITAYGTYRTADFDGDGDVDIWIPVNSTTGTYFRNDGTVFSLQSSTTFPAATFNGRTIIGDFDNDGDDDILFQTGGNGTAFQYARSNGNGTFTTVAQSASPFASVTLPDVTAYGTYRIADFDGDGDDDIWIPVNSTTGTYLRQDGSGFSSQSSGTFPAPSFNARTVIGDFDADGDDDILYQTGANGTPFQYARSNGNGTFTIVSQSASPFAGLFLPDIASFGAYRVADFDGDGDVDKWVPANNTTGTYFRQEAQPPFLSSATPANNAMSVATNVPITLVFSEAVTKNVGNIYIVREADNVIVETIPVSNAQVSGSGTTFTVSRTLNLAGFTWYNIRLELGTFKNAGSVVSRSVVGTTFRFRTGAVLPVHWMDFRAVINASKVKLSWKVAEINTQGYQIERSINGLHFETIGKQKATLADGEHQYTWLDEGVLTGYTYFYRIKSVDRDGKTSYSPLATATVPGEKRAGLQVLRNSASHVMARVVVPESGRAMLCVYTASGAVLQTRQVTLNQGENLLSFDNFPPASGVYLISVEGSRLRLQQKYIQ